MSGTSRSFDEPDEVRKFEHGEVAVVNLSGSTAGRSTMEPGWRWSTSVQPIVGGERCQGHHLGYALTGTLRVVPDDGDEFEISGGNAYEILPGHDAYVVGDDTFQGLEFNSATAKSYAATDE